VIITEESEDKKKPTQPQKTQPKAKKEKPSVRKGNGKAAFSHPWLATTLRFHSGQVLGLDFSPNGKYLITCADGKKKQKF
jgi:WD40 repeat protein